MLVLRAQGNDVAGVRFAISPLAEVYSSVLALDAPDSRALHRRWIESSRARIPTADLELLRALRPSNAYMPDFVHPPPSSPSTRLEDEIAVMLETSPDQIRAEVQLAYRGASLPPVLRPFLTAPEAAVAHLAEVISKYWLSFLAPHWERIRALLAGDIFYRAREVADGGVRSLFTDLHDQVRFGDDSVLISKRVDAEIDLGGQGLLLVPSAFIWPRLGAIVKPPWQPTLIYPARGVGLLWETSCDGINSALGALLGGRRAAVLADLEVPRSTTELAQRLGVSAPSVSQHLSILREAGLVQSNRLRRAVLYSRTARGNNLVAAETPSPGVDHAVPVGVTPHPSVAPI